MIKNNMAFMLAAAFCLTSCANCVDILRIYDARHNPPSGCQALDNDKSEIGVRMRESVRDVFDHQQLRPEYIEFMGPYQCKDKIIATARGMPFFAGRGIMISKRDGSEEISIISGL